MIVIVEAIIEVVMLRAMTMMIMANVMIVTMASVVMLLIVHIFLKKEERQQVCV